MSRIERDYLLKLGFVPNKYGYLYLVELIETAKAGNDILPLKYNGYRKLSQKYGKSVQCIEKDIQNAISAAWLNGDIDVLYEEFGETIDMTRGKPGNKQFILTAAASLSVV